MDLLTTLVLGNFVFTAGAYAWAWQLHRLVTNHQRHEIDELKRKVSQLEKGVQG